SRVDAQEEPFVLRALRRRGRDLTGSGCAVGSERGDEANLLPVGVDDPQASSRWTHGAAGSWRPLSSRLSRRPWRPRGACQRRVGFVALQSELVGVEPELLGLARVPDDQAALLGLAEH